MHKVDVEFSFTVCKCKRDISEKNEDKKEVRKTGKETEFITKTELLKAFSSILSCPLDY